MFHITCRSSSNKEFQATLSDEVFNNFINNQNTLNEWEIKILASFHYKVITAANNPFAATNKHGNFLIGLSESLL